MLELSQFGQSAGQAAQAIFNYQSRSYEDLGLSSGHVQHHAKAGAANGEHGCSPPGRVGRVNPPASGAASSRLSCHRLSCVSNQSVFSYPEGQPTHACTHNVVADRIIAMSHKLNSAVSTFNILQYALHQKRTPSLLVPGSAHLLRTLGSLFSTSEVIIATGRRIALVSERLAVRSTEQQRCS